MFFIPFGTKEPYSKQRFAYVTWLLALINIGVFGYMIYIGVTYGDAALGGFLNAFAATPADVTDSTPFEPGLLTSMFLHAGLLHIAGNMLYFLPFGDNVEDRLGHFRYLLFYLICGLIATLVFILFNPSSTTPLVGASGAIAGVLAGYLVLHPRGSVNGLLIIIIFFTRVHLPAILFIGYWFFIQLYSISTSSGVQAEGGGVAYVAHVAGFVAGLILAPLLSLGVKRKALSVRE